MDNDLHELLVRVRRIEKKLDEFIASQSPEPTTNDEPIAPVEEVPKRMGSLMDEVGAA